MNEKLKKETSERVQEAKANLEKELMALCGQAETAKVNVVTKFKASQPFIDTCVVYYGDEFKDFLKQVKFVHTHFDLSKVTMDDPLSSTPTGGNTISEETDEPN